MNCNLPKEKQEFLKVGDNKGIFAQLDNFTCMFYDCTIGDVFEWLRVDISKYYGDLYRERRMFSNMCAYQFQWNGINVQAQNLSCFTMKQAIDQNDTISEDYAPDQQDFIDVFELTLNAIRLELTGTGLQYMRDFVDSDIDIYLRDFSKKPSNMKVTRCDFAYDFINYMPDILDAVINYAQAYCSDSGRVLTYGGRGYKCEVTTVGQKKVYLGSSQSEKMLRIYDKRLQQLDRKREVYLKPNKYGNPDSWIRFEFQCRNDVAHKLCYGSSLSPDTYIQPDLFSIFKTLMGDYMLVDPDTNSHNRRPYQPWLDIWDWEELDELYKMQNADDNAFVPYSEKLRGFIRSIAPSVVAFMDSEGVSPFFAELYRYILSLNDDDEIAFKRKARFSMREAMLDIESHKIIQINNGNYDFTEQFKFLFLSSNASSQIKEQYNEK